MPKGLVLLLSFLLLSSAWGGEPSPQVSAASSYAKWKNGPAHEVDFFPIAVWLQNPNNAKAYRKAGINTYVALWRGPTVEQLTVLKEAGMKVICHLNETARQNIKDPAIIGWMHGDEPDNAQPMAKDKGYGPPIPPSNIVADYNRIREIDPSRPVMLNLGQGVAWDNWRGRGVRTNHPEDYLEYVKGCDIASFDIYPVAHSNAEISGNLWYVARGVERLAKWAGNDRLVWNCIECTRISEPLKKATPLQVRCEVWMSIIHGSKGIIYFVHEWKPVFKEAALLDDLEMLSAVTSLNQQIQRLAPVLNGPTPQETAQVAYSDPNVPVAVMTKEYSGEQYLFAVAMRQGETTATFRLKSFQEGQIVEVLDENRTILIQKGSFSDKFNPWESHLYRIKRTD